MRRDEAEREAETATRARREAHLDRERNAMATGTMAVRYPPSRLGCPNGPSAAGIWIAGRSVGTEVLCETHRGDRNRGEDFEERDRAQGRLPRTRRPQRGRAQRSRAGWHGFRLLPRWTERTADRTDSDQDSAPVAACAAIDCRRAPRTVPRTGEKRHETGREGELDQIVSPPSTHGVKPNAATRVVDASRDKRLPRYATEASQRKTSSCLQFGRSLSKCRLSADLLRKAVYQPATPESTKKALQC
jgi:hypothetical protein